MTIFEITFAVSNKDSKKFDLFQNTFSLNIKYRLIFVVIFALTLHKNLIKFSMQKHFRLVHKLHRNEFFYDINKLFNNTKTNNFFFRAHALVKYQFYVSLRANAHTTPFESIDLILDISTGTAANRLSTMVII